MSSVHRAIATRSFDLVGSFLLVCFHCIGALDNLAMRLESEGSFNIESVLSPLKDQISTAIMAYHSKSTLINTKVSCHAL